jgi:DNA-binding NarL/FixJ family response regulator
VRVLIVDDQETFREGARELLEARGYVVVGDAADGPSALAAAAHLAPDAVLLDVGLGDESGFDVAQALTCADPALAVLLVSISDNDVLAERVGACGARGFLRKDRLLTADLSEFWSSPDAEVAETS